MATGNFVAYYRVSTQKQGNSGLGLEAQKQAVSAYLNGGSWNLLSEFTEVESGKRDDNRPQLKAALDACRATGSTLVVAKLDRLARNAHFLLGLQQSGVKFVAADMPDANDMTVGIMAVIAQGEAKAISKRTKEALAAAKARGQKLGTNNLTIAGTVKGLQAAKAAKQQNATSFAAVTLPLIRAKQQQGLSLNEIARQLTKASILTPRKTGSTWTATSVKRLLERG